MTALEGTIKCLMSERMSNSQRSRVAIPHRDMFGNTNPPSAGRGSLGRDDDTDSYVDAGASGSAISDEYTSVPATPSRSPTLNVSTITPAMMFNHASPSPIKSNSATASLGYVRSTGRSATSGSARTRTRARRWTPTSTRSRSWGETATTTWTST